MRVIYNGDVWERSSGTHSAVEAHGGNVTLDGRVLLVAATRRLAVERALGQRLLEPGALHLVHVHRPHAYTISTQFNTGLMFRTLSLAKR